MPPRSDASWELSQAALDRLMARLDPDPDVAGQQYEALRLTLSKFFDWRGALAPDECADETLDRVARKLEAGEDILDLRAFAYGVARLVLLERLRHPATKTVTLDVDTAAPMPDATVESPIVACFETCLDELSDDARALILGYYVGKEREKVEARVALARELDLSQGALRSRAQRIRDRLERCTGRCVRARADAADRDAVGGADRGTDTNLHTPALHGRRGPSPRT